MAIDICMELKNFKFDGNGKDFVLITCGLLVPPNKNFDPGVSFGQSLM